MCVKCIALHHIIGVCFKECFPIATYPNIGDFSYNGHKTMGLVDESLTFPSSMRMKTRIICPSCLNGPDDMKLERKTVVI